MQAIAEEIWHAASTKPGPILFILGGVHGNEVVGIEAVRALREAIESQELVLSAGELFLGIGNPQAVTAGTRFIEGRDLNRCFTDAHLLSDSEASAEARRARELAGFIRRADITMDIHSTNKPSVPFVSSRNDPAHRRIYRWLKADIILTDPLYILSGEPATTDEYADRVGKIGICIETGGISSGLSSEAVVGSLKAAMRDLGMISGELDGARPSLPKQGYMLTEAIVLDERGFRYAEGKGEYSFQPVLGGETIGYRGEESIRAKETGAIVFPKLPEHRILGKPVGYLAKAIDPELWAS